MAEDEKPTEEYKEEVSHEINLAIFMTKTDLFRKQLTKDFAELKTILGDFAVEIRGLEKSLTNLPCKERKAWYDGMGKQVAFMWGVLIIFLVVCITAIVKSNVAEHQVTAMRTDVDQIKKVSYGYQDYIEFLKSHQQKP